jgi:hypothetical protein
MNIAKQYFLSFTTAMYALSPHLWISHIIILHFWRASPSLWTTHYILSICINITQQKPHDISLTFSRLTTYYIYMSYHTAKIQTLHFIYLFNKYTYWIFYTCCTLSVFCSSKCHLFHNATFFGSCIIHILNTGVLKFKRKFRRLKVN